MENVCEGTAHQLAAEVLAPEMHLSLVHASTADVGYASCRRLRGWLVAVRKDAGLFIDDVQTIYDKIAEALQEKQVKIPELWWADEQMCPGLV